MLNRLSELGKNKTLINGGLFSIYSFINQGVSFFLLVLLAKYILPDDYGRLSLYNTVIMFLGYFMAFSTDGYLNNSFFRNDLEGYKKDLTSIVVLALFSLACYLLIVLAIFVPFNINIGFKPIYLLYAVFVSFFNCMINIWLGYYRVREKVINYGGITITNALCNFVLSLLFVIGLKQGWLGRVEAQFLCITTIGAVALIFFLKNKLIIVDLSKERFKKLLFWGMPLIPHLASIWVKQGCDRYIINYYHSIYDVGLFSFALNLTSVIIMIGMGFNQTNSVSLYRLLSNKDEKNIKARLHTMNKKFVLLYLMAAVIISIILSVLVPIFLPTYREAVPYFQILSIYGFVQCIYFLYCNYLFFYDKTKTLMYITFGTSLLHFILSLLLTRYSLYITSVVYILTQTLVVLLVYRQSQKLIKDHIG